MKQIRPATLQDIPALLLLAEQFINEAHYDMKFDKEISQQSLAIAIEDESTAVFVDDGVKSAVICTVHRDFCTKPICYVDYFYISPVLRGTGIDRVFIQAVITFAKLLQAAKVHVFNHFAFDERIGNKFRNMLAKNEFINAGSNFLRVI